MPQRNCAQWVELRTLTAGTCGTSTKRKPNLRRSVTTVIFAHGQRCVSASGRRLHAIAHSGVRGGRSAGGSFTPVATGTRACAGAGRAGRWTSGPDTRARGAGRVGELWDPSRRRNHGSLATVVMGRQRMGAAQAASERRDDDRGAAGPGEPALRRNLCQSVPEKPEELHKPTVSATAVPNRAVLGHTWSDMLDRNRPPT